MEAVDVRRIFTFKDERFPDPNPQLTAEEVIETLSVLKPELACGFVKEKKLSEDDDGAMEYIISSNVGTKA
jgi:PRTRC genetic system protein C